MDSGLTPREIQTRIRGGEPVAEVAASAGVSVEHIEVFAGPVMAERRHVAGNAQTGPVRRRGESSSARSLSAVVLDRLSQLSLSNEDVSWDAWRDPDRRWTVKASYQSGDVDHEALFTYDLRGRFSVAANDDARWLIGEVSSTSAAPAAAKKDPDTEPTVDLNDEMALVRATQPGSKNAGGAAKATTAAQKKTAGTEAALSPETPAKAAVDDTAATKPASGRTSKRRTRKNTAAVAATSTPESTDHDPADYSEAELEATDDGVYDLVPPASDMDVLYDMLSSFNEDSVNIYAGLTNPVTAEDEVVEEVDTDELPTETEPTETEPTDAEPTETAPTDAAPTDAGPVEPTSRKAAPVDAGNADPTNTPRADPMTEPQQDSLLSEEQEPTLVRPRSDLGSAAAATQATPKPTKRKRAQVPSWDEIMFGSPTPKEPQG